MMIRILAAAVALTIPAVTAFASCNHGKQEASMSCAEGSVYDAHKGACVAISS